MKTILLFDPYPIVGLGFGQVLNAANADFETVVVTNVEALAESGSKVSPDLLVLTINSPKHKEPMPLLTVFQSAYPGVPVVLFDEEHYASHLDRWLRCGASGYLLKGEPINVLVECIDVVLGGGKYLSPMGWDRYLSPKQITGHPLTAKLGMKEYEVAKLLSVGKSTSWIAGKMDRKASTISTMKKRIFNKLRVGNIIDLNKILPSVTVIRRGTRVRALNRPLEKQPLISA